MTREYSEELVLSLDDIHKIRAAQYAIWEEGFSKSNPDAQVLGIRLSASTSILGLAFKLPQATALAVGVVSIIAGLLPSTKRTLEEMVRWGHWHLDNPIAFLDANPSYDRVRIRLPFIEYPYNNGYIRFVTGMGSITGARHTDGTWYNIN